ncbi:HAMP domain-containing histidine kinase [Mucilaginibacter gilvus]|uniref:histidine kinase n=2 Tax=Mucilaginibacter gilvus TaxID=2305909 RepID=A0A3S3VFU2_9SPHI|nr:HAMP domain-containing histidine kinase [Mucilaginibacter gilvus]
MSTYLSEVKGHEKSKNFRDFFLSAEWQQFRQAYNNMRFNNIGSRFNADTKGDSTFVEISLRFLNGSTAHYHHGPTVRFDNGVPLIQLKAEDHNDQLRMDSTTREKLSMLGFSLATFRVIYSYDNNKSADHPLNEVRSADFSSQQYGYNMKFLNMYQLVVPSVTGLIYYRMRYYLISSFFMLALTIAAFFFILRLMRNHRLYAKARLSFTGNMTHELKTPVATVAIALESIIENHMENDPAALRSYLQISRSELKRLNLIIDKVLNLDELDSNQTRSRSELFDVQQGLTEVIGSMLIQIDNMHATVNWKPMETPCFVSGDPVHLTNVFYNLIENALKYGGQGVKLDIACTRNANEIKISFKDSGPGIAGIYRQRVFERFFRIPAGDNEVHNVKGTGLGLNYVKQIIEKHGGHISLESEPGTGSNFIIYLKAVS